MRDRESFHTKRLNKAQQYKIMGDAIISTLNVLDKELGVDIYEHIDCAVDLGSSIGMLNNAFVEALFELRGVRDFTTIDVDGSDYAKEFWNPSKRKECKTEFIQCDLNDWCDKEKKLKGLNSGLIFTFECAEHLTNMNSILSAVTFVHKCPSIMFFCAARPGQPGNGHICMKEPLEWIRFFKDMLGYTYRHQATMMFARAVGMGELKESIVETMRTNKNVTVNDCYFNTMVFTKGFQTSK